MNINYRILKIDNEARSVAVRYFTDILSEDDLSSLKDTAGDPILGEDGRPVQCMSDTNLTLYDIDNPTESDVTNLIKRAVPSSWLKLREDIKLGLVTSDLSSLETSQKEGSFLFVANDPLQENQVALTQKIDPSVILTSKMTNGLIASTPTVNNYQLNIALNAINISQSDVVYDLATGGGRLAIQAAKMGAGRVIGIDIDPDSITKAADNAASNAVNVEFINDDIFNVSYDDATILLINVTHGLLHRFAIEVFPSLKPGTKVVSFSNSFHWVAPDQVLCDTDQDIATYIWIVK